MMSGDCHAIGCRARILNTQVMCERHLAMLQSDTRRLLVMKFRPRGKQTQVFDRVLALAREEVLFHQTNGHRLPAARGFQWDDNERIV